MKHIFDPACVIFTLLLGSVLALSQTEFLAFTAPTGTVAIHISEATAKGWDTLATDTADGNLALAHSHTSGWKYWHIYGFLMEQLRSDGTPFTVVSDADIADGRLMVTDADRAADVEAGRPPRRRGMPKYAVIFSLANTCASAAVAAGVDGFVLAGGHAVVGSTSWTRDSACGIRELPAYQPNGVASAPRVIASAENEFLGYPASATIDAKSDNLWLNAITDRLPTWIEYRFEHPAGLLPTIARVALLHSTYEERGFGYTYRIADYAVQISSDPGCKDGTFSTVASDHGNDINREYQVISFAPRPARCVRIVVRSSYERTPYSYSDVTQWVGLAGFQAFDANDNALIRNADVAGDPWRPLGLRPLKVDGCFDHLRRTDPGFSDALLSHFEPDGKTRGYRLATNQKTSGYDQRHHWGQAVTIATPPGEQPATVLAVDDAVIDPNGASICFSGSEKPIFAKRQRGQGWYLYSASFNSLAGWSMHSSVSYVYGVYRHAIDQAHRDSGLPNVRLGAWPWPYVAGFMTRHDHWSHFGFDGNPSTLLDNTLAALIEHNRDALTGGQTPRDFPVKGSYFLLNEVAGVGKSALPEGSGACASGPAACDSQIRSTVQQLLSLGAELGTHSYRPSTNPDGAGFLDERNKLQAYIGASINPGIYVSHGAYAHFDQDDGILVGVQTMADNGVVAKGDDAFGAHPHFALKISSDAISSYGNHARWKLVEIPATAYATQPKAEPEQWPGWLGVISHEIASEPSACNTDSTPPRLCMQKAVDLVYRLGGIINVYDHIGDSRLTNPTAAQFAAYIDYTQALPFVYTTSTRDIAQWWTLRDGIRVSRRHTCGDTGNSLRIAIEGTSSRRISLDIDLPNVSTTDPQVGVGGKTMPKCPPLASGAELKTWLASAAVGSGCYIREGNRIRVGVPAPSSVFVNWP
jgi:hypothetical protein